MKNNIMTRSALMISICTLISKGLGFLRVIMIASRFGSGMETDTYNAAMTATVVIVGALGSAINTTLIPIFSNIEEEEGKKGKLKFLNNIINLVLISTILMIIVGFFISPIIIKLAAKGFKGEQFKLAVKLNRIGLPIIMLLGFIHVLAGFLHSSKVFGPPAIAGIPYNIVFLIYLIFFATSPNIETLMVVTVIGTFFQFLIHVPAIKSMGYKYKLKINLKDKYLRNAIFLVGPVLIGSAVQQINVVIDKTLGSELVAGSLSALDYASKMNEMVVAVFVMGITTVVFPMISEAFAKDDVDQMTDILTTGVNTILLIVVPATIGLMLLAKPVIYLFFERNAFGPRATNMTSIALVFYSLGLVGTSLRLLLNRVYYSFQDTVTPMKNGIIAVIINIILNIILVRFLDHGGLALATSISGTVSMLLLFKDLKKRYSNIDVESYFEGFLKTTIASLIMGFVVILIYYRIGSMVSQGKAIQMLMFILSIIGGIITYGGACKLLKIEEFNILINKVLKRNKN